MSDETLKLPGLPKPELTCWYGPSSEFYEEPMYSADQLRELQRQTVEVCIQACIREEEMARKACNWQAVYATVQCGDRLRDFRKSLLKDQS